MSVMVKGMKMPKSCFGCDFQNPFAEVPYCRRLMKSCPKTSRLEDCPLAEVPTPHGRLGDLDRLYKHIKAECNIYGKPTIGFEDGNKVLKIITDTHTVIEAEEEQ